MRKFYFFISIIFFCVQYSHAQLTPKTAQSEVYLDKNGILKNTVTDQPAYYLGINYTEPFVFGYRNQKKLGYDIYKAMEQDVYHIHRLGVNAFRIHVFDIEITDIKGNLLENDHLKALDYLISLFEKRGIKIILTPLAFWGNGYPEKDTKTAGFSSTYDKGKVTVEEPAIKAQENYLKQLFKHKNSYTNKNYIEDANIIAFEVNNEPNHSGTIASVQSYIDRLITAMKSVGCKKPIYYNISESPKFAKAVINSKANGYSMQWYPTRLLSGHTLLDNNLPNVNHYYIPFDTIPGFKGKGKIIYEFESADVLQPIMYPMMAKSFKDAGFQWATQFEYDPMNLANSNTEYGTHYMNLAYTPDKALSLLIAGKVFRNDKWNPGDKTYPKDSIFGHTLVSYKQQLSVYNSDTDFIYTNTTEINPITKNKLLHIAGTGTSPIVNYNGNGAYFLDKISDNTWRLEVMPDYIQLADPFGKTNIHQSVRQIICNENQLTLNLPNFANNYFLKKIDGNNSKLIATNGNTTLVTPGVYLIATSQNDLDKISTDARWNNQKLNEFVAPVQDTTENIVWNTPKELPANKDWNFKIQVANIQPKDSIVLWLRHFPDDYHSYVMQRLNAREYEANIPKEWMQSGEMSIQISRVRNGNYLNFPGKNMGNPYDWDQVNNNYSTIKIVDKSTDLVLFNAEPNLYPRVFPDTLKFQLPITNTGNLVQNYTITPNTNEVIFGWENSFVSEIANRRMDLDELNHLEILGNTSQDLTATIGIIDANGNYFAKNIYINKGDFAQKIAISELVAKDRLLLPIPYPSFQKLWYKIDPSQKMEKNWIEKIQIQILKQDNRQLANTCTFGIEKIALTK